jgi:hypothetical protein
MSDKSILKSFIHDISNKVMILEGYLSLVKIKPDLDIKSTLIKLDDNVMAIGKLLDNMRQHTNQITDETSLVSLVYSSKVKDYITDIMLESELDKIHKTSEKFNTDNNITGYLFYMDGYFIQYIEGSQENIEKLYLKISLDDRHSDITLLSHLKITEREFQNWTKLYKMALHKQSQIPDVLKAIVGTKKRLLSKTESLALVNFVSLISNKTHHIVRPLK